MNHRWALRCCVAAVVALWPVIVHAHDIHVAVAANFGATLRTLGRLFGQVEGHRIVPSQGSTGQLYAQITKGAPFDVFLAADSERPLRLEEQGLGVAGTRFVYAKGTLLLWSPKALAVDARGHILDELASTPQILAIADPRTAPYGAAAKALLQRRGLWSSLEKRGRLAIASSVSQAYQFVMGGGAAIGFVALSQVIDAQCRVRGSHFRVPVAPGALDQQAILLVRARHNQPARQFLNFIRRDPRAHAVIERAGYEPSVSR